MEYLITFLEGLISFISPCMLPMLPIYLGYFAGAAGESGEEKKKAGTLLGAVCFVAGFTVIFVAMGLLVGTIGRFLARYQTVLNIVCGVIVIFLGLVFMNVIPLPMLSGIRKQWKITGPFSAFVFGMIFSISLTPCVGAFLGSALMLASTTGGAAKGAVLLFVYSMGLGIPFILSAVLIGYLASAFTFIKKHYRVIEIVSGSFLIIVGVMMALGWLNKLLAVLSFS